MAALLVKNSTQFLKSSAAVAGFAGNYTEMAWVKRTASPGSGYECLFGVTNRGALHIRNSGSDEPYAISTINCLGVCGPTVAAGVWVHVAIRRLGTNLRMVINGVVQADLLVAQADTTAILADVFEVGSGSAGGASYLDGSVADMACWNVALPDAELARPYSLSAEVAALLAAGLIATQPINHWKLDATSGTITNGEAGLTDMGTIPTNLIIGGGAPVWTAGPTFLPISTGVVTQSRGMNRPNNLRPSNMRPAFRRMLG